MKDSWFRRLLSGKPHFIIGGNADPYMLRWFLVPRNRRFNIYLHKFLRDDEDRALHDHPWWFISLILKGGYFERVGQGVISRRAGSIAFRKATHRHRVILFVTEEGKRRPCWTIVITGQKKRTWGFWCPKGFVPWHEFVDGADTGQVGKGCD